MKTKFYTGKIVLLACLLLAGLAGKAQTKVFATTVTSSSSPTTAGAVTSAGNAVDNDPTLQTSARLLASPGYSVTQGIVLGNYTSTINLKFATTLPANTASYVKIGTQDQLLPLLLGGAVGNLVNGTVNAVLTGGQRFTIEAKLDATTRLTGTSNATGGFNTDQLRVVIDENGNYLLRIVPAQTYNTITITNSVSSSLIGVTAITRYLDVYGAYYVSNPALCNAGKLTSYTGENLVTLINYSVTNPQNVIDSNQSNYSTLNIGAVSAVTSLSQTVYFQEQTTSSDEYYVRLRVSQQLLDANIAGRITIRAYNGTTQVGTTQSLSQLISLNLLTLQGGQIATARFKPGAAIDRITLTLASVVDLNLGQSVDFYGVTRVAALPVITIPGAIACPGTPSAITATTIAQGAELRWYSAPTGGTLLATVASGQAFVTPAITANTTYYVASARTGCPEESVRVPAAVSVVTAVTTFNGTTWNNGVPTAFDKLINVTGSYAPDADVYGCNMTVANNAVVIIPEGRNITLNGFLNVEPGSTFTLQDDANLIQIPNVQNSGTITAIQDSSLLYRLDYTIWTSPVTGIQTLKQFSPATVDNRFYIYDTASDKYLSSQHTTAINPLTQTFSLGKGYLIRMPNTNSTPGYNAGTTPIIHQGNFIGTPNNGTVDVPVVTAGLNFNAIGNPYPSPVNVYNFIDENQSRLADGTLYIWRKKNDYTETSYATITKLAYVANEAEGGNTAGAAFNGTPSNWVINQGQGFIVKVVPGTPAIRFENKMRRSTINGQFFRNGDTATDSNLSRIWLNIAGTGPQFGQAVIGYTPEATNDIDYGWDGAYFEQEATAIYTIAANKNLTIQARPDFTDADIVAVGFRTTVAGTYTIAVPNRDGVFAQGQDVLLKDNYTGTIHNFNDGAYTFTTEAGTNHERFEIIYKNAPALGIADNVLHGNEVVVYKKDNTLHITSGSAVINAVTVHDIRGSVIYKGEGINAAETKVSNLQAQNQVLIVTITTNKGIVSKKVLF